MKRRCDNHSNEKRERTKMNLRLTSYEGPFRGLLLVHDCINVARNRQRRFAARVTLIWSVDVDDRVLTLIWPAFAGFYLVRGKSCRRTHGIEIKPHSSSISFIGYLIYQPITRYISRLDTAVLIYHILRYSLFNLTCHIASSCQNSGSCLMILRLSILD